VIILAMAKKHMPRPDSRELMVFMHSLTEDPMTAEIKAWAKKNLYSPTGTLEVLRDELNYLPVPQVTKASGRPAHVWMSRIRYQWHQAEVAAQKKRQAARRKVMEARMEGRRDQMLALAQERGRHGMGVSQVARLMEISEQSAHADLDLLVKRRQLKTNGHMGKLRRYFWHEIDRRRR